MDEIMALDLKSLVTNTIYEVFDTMLSMEIRRNEEECRKTKSGLRFVGSVSFAGEVMGNVNIRLNEIFARIITRAMLRMDSGENVMDEDIEDVIGELSNIVCGDLKSRFCDIGFPCELSIPSVTSGSDFKIESMNWMRYECVAFKHKEHLIDVEIYIKSAR